MGRRGNQYKKDTFPKTGIVGKKENNTFPKSPAVSDLISFSFKYIDFNSGDISPTAFSDGYTCALMNRLRLLSDWTARNFVDKPLEAFRSHAIDWSGTAQSWGFTSPNAEGRAAPAYQFCVEERRYGRVHGYFVGSVFYVVWLDHDHKLYPLV